jgi:hypothetical protein
LDLDGAPYDDNAAVNFAILSNIGIGQGGHEQRQWTEGSENVSPAQIANHIHDHEDLLSGVIFL